MKPTGVSPRSDATTRPARTRSGALPARTRSLRVDLRSPRSYATGVSPHSNATSSRSRPSRSPPIRTRTAGSLPYSSPRSVSPGSTRSAFSFTGVSPHPDATRSRSRPSRPPPLHTRTAGYLPHSAPRESPRSVSPGSTMSTFSFGSVGSSRKMRGPSGRPPQNDITPQPGDTWEQVLDENGNIVYFNSGSGELSMQPVRMSDEFVVFE